MSVHSHYSIRFPWPARRLAVTVSVAIGVLLSVTHGAMGQATRVDSIRLEFRIQPQVGLPGDVGGVVDVPGTAHLPITGPGQVRRFEVQYRLLDLDPADNVVPWSVLSFQFTLAFTGGANATLERAVLSRAETNGAQPPALSPDLSGQQTGSFAPPFESRGLHHAFLRDHGSGLHPPSNDGGENGVFAPGPGGPNQVIRDVAAIRNNLGPAIELGAWYGLYSVNFISGADRGTDVMLTAAIVPSEAGVAFGFLTEEFGVPLVSGNYGSEGATIAVPAPGPFGLAAVAVAFAAGRRRRCGRMSGIPQDGAQA